MEFKTIKHKKHYLFDTIDEFKAFYPEDKIVGNWRKGNTGDWVFTDDMYVCQVLKRGSIYEKVDQASKDFIRTVCGTFIIQKLCHKMKGEYGIPENIYAFSGNFNAKKTYQGENKLNNKEFLFARYVAEGYDTIEAYKKVYKKSKSPRYIQRKTSTMLRKESIRKMVKDEIKKILQEEGVTSEWIIGRYRDIADLAERDSDKLRSLESLTKISGLFDTEKKQEQLTVWQGFSPEQLEAINGGQTKVIAHAEKEDEE
tara:strand:+ start:471 stop:1238 length:768 start_codon:yes stop_codon:yes gene_type:complete